MTVKVTKDRVAEVMAQIRRVDDNQVLVGFPGETSARGEAINNPTLAYILDRGSPAANIPARPFLTPGVQAAEAKIGKAFEVAVRKALDGDNGAIRRGLNQAGTVAVGSVQQKMTTGPFAPLKPATIRRKGSSRPLIDTGALRAAVSYVIRPK